MRNLCALLLILGLSSNATAALDAKAVRNAAAYSASHGGLSFLVLQDGKTLQAANANEALRIFSGTKAFWNLAALAAVQDGILNLDERVAATIPSWRDDPRKARVTIRQLLDFSAGLEPGFRLHADDPGDRDAIALRLPMVAEPGAAFVYGPSALQVFHAVLKAKLRDRPPRAYLERRVLRKMGLGPQRYLLDRAGNPLLAAGWILSAQQWARLGKLTLQEGSPVISQGSSANRAFAFGWWNNRAAPGGREFDFERMLTPRWSAQDWREACICREAPRDLLVSIGSRGQRLYVIPSLRLVVVRHGNGAPFSDARFLRLLLDRAQKD